ncbi:hypothetical protein GFV16_13450 [Bacillus megaterium]|uniref:hypothetical protein n=1 Tax=Priestia megaterium TaxID=1404 RepID=UPI000CA096FD|nr:hypothetical protein [Priestia megaterium]AUO10318.1 hypothetical protein C0569_03180 [Priestia megaterium]MQR86919.1 hypothetical protein [Priestia megaterium]RMA90780.1 hypothetical protein DEU44_2866 [Priestia megaterium]
MDWVKIVYSFILLVCGILIFVSSSSRKGDERKKFISTKAQSYSFMIVIGVLILDVVESIYRTFQGKSSYDGIGISPLMFLTTISVVYLITFLTYRKKYGD